MTKKGFSHIVGTADKRIASAFESLALYNQRTVELHLQGVYQ